MADFVFLNHGSIWILRADTDEAQEWASKHLEHEETQHWAGGIVVERRYIESIIEGIQNDGMSVEIQ